MTVFDYKRTTERLMDTLELEGV